MSPAKAMMVSPALPSLTLGGAGQLADGVCVGRRQLGEASSDQDAQTDRHQTSQP